MIEGFGELLGIPVVAPVGDAVELLGAEITLWWHRATIARRWPIAGGRRFDDLRGACGRLVSQLDEIGFQNGKRRSAVVPRQGD